MSGIISTRFLVIQFSVLHDIAYWKKLKLRILYLSNMGSIIYVESNRESEDN